MLRIVFRVRWAPGVNVKVREPLGYPWAQGVEVKVREKVREKVGERSFERKLGKESMETYDKYEKVAQSSQWTGDQLLSSPLTWLLYHLAPRVIRR